MGDKDGAGQAVAAAASERQEWRKELSREGQGSMEGEASWSEQGEGLISRRPSWLAAPDRELGKGQPPRGRGWFVHAEGDPQGALARSMRVAGSMRAQQALGARP